MVSQLSPPLVVLKIILPEKYNVLLSTGENITGAVLINLTLPDLTGSGEIF